MTTAQTSPKNLERSCFHPSPAGVNPAKHTLLQGSQETLGARSSTSSPQVTGSNSPTHPILVIHPRCLWIMRTHNDKRIGSQDGNLHRSSTRGNGFPKGSQHVISREWTGISGPILPWSSHPVPSRTRQEACMLDAPRSAKKCTSSQVVPEEVPLTGRSWMEPASGLDTSKPLNPVKASGLLVVDIHPIHVDLRLVS